MFLYLPCRVEGLLDARVRCMAVFYVRDTAKFGKILRDFRDDCGSLRDYLGLPFKNTKNMHRYIVMTPDFRDNMFDDFPSIRRPKPLAAGIQNVYGDV